MANRPKSIQYQTDYRMFNISPFRFRYEFKSQELWTELKFVLDNFAAPLTELFEVCFTFIQF